MTVTHLSVAIVLAGGALLRSVVRRRGANAFAIFIGLFMLFVPFGIIVVSIYAHVYQVHPSQYIGRTSMEALENLKGGIAAFAATGFMLLVAHPSPQRHSKGGDVIDVRRLMVNFRTTVLVIQVFAIAMCVWVLMGVDLRAAPLLNIGTYTIKEMDYYRWTFFDNGLVARAAVLRYLAFYLGFPALGFFKGIGARVSWITIALTYFVVLLTLAKTGFILISVGILIGTYLRTRSIRSIAYWISIIIVGFFVVVWGKYATEISRSFVDVTNVLVIRSLAIPIVISGAYSEIYSYDMGLRSSEWYTYIVGGKFIILPQDACRRMVGATCNMTTGIFGMAFPNIPRSLHWAYFALFQGVVFASSVLVSLIRDTSASRLIMIAVGFSSGFIFLTEPFTALNSYGFVYATIVALALVGTQGRSRRFSNTRANLRRPSKRLSINESPI